MVKNEGWRGESSGEVEPGGTVLSACGWVAFGMFLCFVLMVAVLWLIFAFASGRRALAPFAVVPSLAGTVVFLLLKAASLPVRCYSAATMATVLSVVLIPFMVVFTSPF